tara:strand:- start:674 stop:988 length:315 start_codon:yes stop_codon:yes gene_type:complete
MIKIINEKIYNTEKAEEIAEYYNGYCTSDFNHYQETLYLTKKKSWFLHVKGGALSCMAKPVGSNGMGGSEDIEDLTEEEALEWMKKNQEVTLIESFFPGELEEA